MKRACALLVNALSRWQPDCLGSYLGHSGLWGVALALAS